MSKDIPILFSAPMIRALLDGRKTMTRRILSLGNCEFGSFGAGKAAKMFWQEHAAWDFAWTDRGFPDASGAYRSGYLHVPCHDDDSERDGGCAHCREFGWAGTTHRLRPKVQVGDRLWVRENIWQASPYPGTLPSGEPNESNRWSSRMVHYSADGNPPNTPNRHYPNGFREGSGCFSAPDPYASWLQRPSIHMPRWASRITDIVTAVKIERLQDISDIDVIAEGVVAFQSGSTPMFGVHVEGGYEHAGLTPRETFMNLWCALHGPAAWNANPFVVATSFRVIKANIEAPEARIAA